METPEERGQSARGAHTLDRGVSTGGRRWRGRGERVRSAGSWRNPSTPHRPGVGSCDTRPGARSPRLGPGGEGRAGGGARRCAGRRERGGEDSSGSRGQRDGGRTCGLRWEAHPQGGKEARTARLGSEETFGVRGSGRLHLLLQRTRRSGRLSGRLGYPARRWAPLSAALLPPPGPPQAGRLGVQATKLGDEDRAGPGAAGRCTAPWCARLCARAVLGGEEVRRSCLPGDSPPRVSQPPPPPPPREPSPGVASEDCDRPPPPISVVRAGRSSLRSLHPATIRRPPARGPRDCRNLGKRESGGRTSRGVCGEGRSCWSIVCRAGA